jgi:hypothetical protein
MIAGCSLSARVKTAVTAKEKDNVKTQGCKKMDYNTHICS